MANADTREMGGFCDLYARLAVEFAGQIEERRAAYGGALRNVREEIVRCIWFGGHLPRKGVTTDDGRAIEVLSPGWWNVEGGPDFIRAEFLLEGAGRVVGDVEVHTLASGWRAHGHDRRAEYNDVVLHVVMWNDTDRTAVTAENSALIPQLTLSRVIEDDIEELVELMDPDGEPSDADARPAEAAWPSVRGKFCGKAWRKGKLEATWLERLLDIAGDHRILSRAATLMKAFATRPREQILYERIAEALGFKNNRMPFLQLAGLLPLARLRLAVPPDASEPERALTLEAAYFGVGGFLGATSEADTDPETTAYLDGLRRAWRPLAEGLASAQMSPEHWSLAGTRPVNYPTRRLAALARLCAAHLHGGLFAHFLRTVHGPRPRPRQRPDVAVRNALTSVFTGIEHHYWTHRYSFGGKRLVEAKALVGQERATAILVDVLLPLLLAHARAEDDGRLMARLHEVWRGLPRRPDNTVTRRMGQVIFTTEAEARRVVNSTRRQQGLHQLYRDACRSEDGCLNCVLYLAHQAGKTLSAQGIS